MLSALEWTVAASRRLRIFRRPRQRQPRPAIAGFSGILQVDGYAAYKALVRDHAGAIQLAFCLAHARRKFVEVYKSTKSPFACEVLERLQAVYAIEADIRGTSAEQRLPRPRRRPAAAGGTLPSGRGLAALRGSDE